MRSKVRNLSKSRLLSARQCLKRLWLEVHKPERQVFSAATRAAFSAGHAVGEIARKIYDVPGSVLIPYEGGLEHAIRKTTRLLNAATQLPIFEATLAFGGVLVRIDVLLPDAHNWHIIEVKSSTSLKDEHLFDTAVQSWVFRGLGYAADKISLAHIDNDFVYSGGENYYGLLREVNIVGEVARLSTEVPALVRTARETVAGGEPSIAVGKQCNTPYECPFIGYCWPTDEFPVQSLPRVSKARLGEWIRLGTTDLRLVPESQLTDRQQRVQRVARSGTEELLPGAKAFADSLGYPRYYLDFETIAPAVPRWANTRPYEILPFQWSCHYEASAATVQHAEFLDLSGEPPMRLVAESLIRVLGKSGAVLMYSNYERLVIRGLQRRFPDLAPALNAIIERLVDLKQVTEDNYYHPAMAGSWSLKSVLPTISTGAGYTELHGIQEGTEASEGYLEAIDPATAAPRKAELQQQLLQYCRFDTDAMRRLVCFFAGT
jgi:hypothetical protein